MRPTVVESARAAIEVLRQAHALGTQIPLVLTDAHMPDIDGFGLVERIRQEPSLSNVLIVMLTSGYVSKPLKLEELFSVIEKVVPCITRGSVVEETTPTKGTR